MNIPYIKVVAVVVAAVVSLSCFQISAMAQEDQSWRAGLEEACGKSNEAMALSVKELTTLLEKCDALEKAIQKEEESVRKVYLKRLSLCRNLYAYVLEHKKNEPSTSSSASPSH